MSEGAVTTDAQERDLRALEADIVSNACYWQACGETANDAAALRDVVQQYRRLRDEAAQDHPNEQAGSRI